MTEITTSVKESSFYDKLAETELNNFFTKFFPKKKPKKTFEDLKEMVNNIESMTETIKVQLENYLKIEENYNE